MYGRMVLGTGFYLLILVAYGGSPMTHVERPSWTVEICFFLILLVGGACGYFLPTRSAGAPAAPPTPLLPAFALAAHMAKRLWTG